jgi:rhamnose transport system substrate-binding protein
MRKAFFRVAVIATIMALALPLAVFASGTGEKGGAAGGAAKYAIVFKNTGNPYGDRQMGGFKTGIEEQGFQAILRAPDQPTAEGQIQILEQLISQKVAAICIVGNDKDALQPVLTKAKNAGI